MLKIVENLRVVVAPPQTPLGELTALPQILSWWGGACCPLPKNSTPAVSIWPRLSALRASFGSLPNSLHFPQCSGAWKKHWKKMGQCGYGRIGNFAQAKN